MFNLTINTMDRYDYNHNEDMSCDEWKEFREQQEKENQAWLRHLDEKWKDLQDMEDLPF